KLAFLQSDTPGMVQHSAWARGKPGAETILLSYAADVAAYSGRLKDARELTHQVVASGGRVDEETVQRHQADAALREALFGNPIEAQQRVATLQAEGLRDVQCRAALASALAGDKNSARARANDLAKRFAEDTIVQSIYLPLIRAQLALNERDAAKAMNF